jgi:hypothetical protein
MYKANVPAFSPGYALRFIQDSASSLSHVRNFFNSRSKPAGKSIRINVGKMRRGSPLPCFAACLLQIFQTIT